MVSRKIVLIGMLLAAVQAACAPTAVPPAPASATPTAAAVASATNTSAPASATAASATTAAVATTQAPTVAPASSSTPTPAAGVTPGTTEVAPPDYTDNRSDGVAVLTSYFNAINRHEYARA